MLNTHAHPSLVLEPQIEFSASQVRTLKEFYAEFFDQPATGNEARALARETVDALKTLETELSVLHGQKAQYPFLSALAPVLTTLKDMAGKNPNWFLTDLARAEDALLDTKENTIDPLRRFMRSPQKAIYDQARQLVAEQEDNFAYVGAAEVDAVRGLLDDKSPWQGNRLQQLKPQLDALQHAIEQQLAQEKGQAKDRLVELEQRLQDATEFGQLNPTDRKRLIQPFADARQRIQAHKRIAMIRDQLRRFEDEAYLRLLLQLEQLARPAPPDPAPHPASPGPGGATPPSTPAPEPKLVPARTIKVSYAKPWLASEAELDDYLRKQREAWLKEIQAGNRVQV